MLDMLVSGVVGLLIGLILEEPIKRLGLSFLRGLKKFWNRNKKISDPRFFTLGKQITEFFICDGDGIDYLAPNNIETFIEHTPIEMPEELKGLVAKVEEEQNKLKLENSPDYCWNGTLMTLNKIIVGRTEQWEHMKVRFAFCESNYYTFIALNKNLDRLLPSGETIRSKYLKGQALKDPFTSLANGFGVAIVVITSDNKVILTRRSVDSGVRPNELDISVVEAVNMPMDAGGSGSYKGPDLYKTAIRGAEEELGLNVGLEDVKLLSYGVDYKYYQWNVLGIIESKYKSTEIMANRTRGISGKWEVDNLQFYNFEIKEIMNIIKKEAMWDTGKVALYLALVNRYGKNRVDKIANKVK